MVFGTFMVWMFVMIGRPQDVFEWLQPLRPSLVLGVISLALVFFTTSALQWRSLFQWAETRKYLLFFLVLIVGIPFAYHRSVAFESILFLNLMNLLFFMVFVLLVHSIDRLRRVLVLLIYVLLFYSVFGLMNGSFAEGRFFIYGTMYDPNDIAYVLISLFPFSLLCFVSGGGRFNKIVSVIAAASSVILVLYTGSRGGLLGLATIVGLLLFTNMGSVKATHKLIMSVGLLVGAIFIYENINVERYLSLANVDGDYNVNSETGRLGIWTRAYDLLLQNPILGVGSGCFSMAIGYLRESAGAQQVWQEAHNSYVQVAVETGLLGFSVFLSLIVGSLLSFWRCRSIEVGDRPGSSRNELGTLAGLMQAAFVGHLICAFFLSQGYSLLFTMFFGLSAIMRRLAADSVSAG
jgi:O-antigen ligase